MSEPFMAEIKIISWNFAPQGWAFCNGQLLPINQNQALFSLLGTTYGGDGRVTFGLPDFRGRAPIHVGSGHTLGERGGQESHTVTITELPQHIHFVQAQPAQADTPFIQTASPVSQNVFGTVVGGIYGGPTNVIAMNAASVASVGGNQPHENRQPSLVLNFIIALQGIFPSQS